jgi:hypothetical protein
MSTCSQLLASLRSGAHDQNLAALYALSHGLSPEEADGLFRDLGQEGLF